MLVLSRKPGERVIIDGPGLSAPIVVQLVDIRNVHHARLGFEAPGEITILREEIPFDPKANEERHGYGQ